MKASRQMLSNCSDSQLTIISGGTNGTFSVTKSVGKKRNADVVLKYSTMKFNTADIMLKMLYFQTATNSTDICVDIQEENQQKSILSNMEIDSIQSLSYNSATVTKISEKNKIKLKLRAFTQDHCTSPKVHHLQNLMEKSDGFFDRWTEKLLLYY